MDGARLQAKILKGRAKAGSKIGLPCNVFSPQNPTDPFTNQTGIVCAAFNAADASYLKASGYGKPIWWADYDGTKTCPGDYLARVSDDAVWFVAAQQELLPIQVIECNAQVTIQRETTDATCGTLPYSGPTPLDYVLGGPATAWPASILIGSRALSSIGLPTDVKEGGWRILLPPSVPITIQSSDIFIDDKGRRFAIESAELTDMGWRCNANEAHA